MAEVGSAFVSVIPSARGFGSKLESQVGGETKSTGKRLGTSLGKAFAIAGGAIGAVGFIKSALGEARESQKVGALTAQVIKSTGGAANVTAKQVGSLADAISRKTGIDDETIQSGQNMLLTFKNIRNEAGKGNDIFNQSSKTLIDFASAMKTEPKQAAVQLGKALNDPIKGITALGRAGVQFSEDQKKQIKSMTESGNVMGAQKLILKELQSQFGGAAAAQATAGDKARVAYDNLKETIGTALLPVLDKFSRIFTDKIAPAISGFVTDMQDGTGAAGAIAQELKTLGGFLGEVFGSISRNKATVGTFAGILLTVAAGVRVWSIAQAILNSTLFANPIGLVVLAIAALAAGIVYAYKHSETFRNIVDGAFKAVSTAASFMWNSVLKPTFKFIINAFLAVAGAIVNGAAKAFGWVPGLGPKLKAAARWFNDFKEQVNNQLDGIKPKKIDVTVPNAANAISSLATIRRLIRDIQAAGPVKRPATNLGGLLGERAKGGPVRGGGSYLVGERGPEIFTPPRSGRIIPNDKIGASGSGATYQFYTFDLAGAVEDARRREAFAGGA